jgi:hypothetical protein
MTKYLKSLSTKEDPQPNTPDAEKEECSICFGYFEQSGGPETEWQAIAVVLKCSGKHKYHLKCLEEWTVYKTMCPMCRQEIEPPK